MEEYAIMLENKKGIIFDLDGTLADTMSAITEAINMTMRHFSFPERTEPEVKKAIGNGARMLVKRLVPEEYAEDDDKINEALKHYNAMYALTYLHTTEMYDGMDETVRALLNKGIKVTVFSNKQDAYVKGLVKQFFQNGEISIAIGQTDDIPVKPDPTGVRMILDELSLTAEECVFVGDSGVDVKTAENSGMDFIGAAWGFCGREALEKLGADTVADTPNEITKILKI